jgi:hypothetical protein
MGSGRGLDGISPTDLGITLLYMDSKSFDWPLWRYVTVSRMTVFKKKKKDFRFTGYIRIFLENRKFSPNF